MSTACRGCCAASSAPSTRSQPLPAGAPFVMIDGALVAMETDVARIGRPVRWRVGPAGRDHADPAVVELSSTVGPTALKPLSPVRVKARRECRRRHPHLDPPHPRRRRQLRPCGGAARRGDRGLRRRHSRRRGGEAHARKRRRRPVLYPAAAELADFGAAQATLSLRVAQISAACGRGFPRRGHHRCPIVPISRLPFLAAGQAQKHVTINEALRCLDAVVQLAVESRTLAAPPAAPGEGQRFIVAGAGLDAWAGQGGRIAVFEDGAWRFIVAARGLAGLRARRRAWCSPSSPAAGCRGSPAPRTAARCRCTPRRRR